MLRGGDIIKIENFFENIFFKIYNNYKKILIFIIKTQAKGINWTLLSGYGEGLKEQLNNLTKELLHSLKP